MLSANVAHDLAHFQAVSHLSPVASVHLGPLQPAVLPYIDASDLGFRRVGDGAVLGGAHLFIDQLLLYNNRLAIRSRWTAQRV